MTLASHQIGHGPLITLLVHGFLGAGRNLGGLARAWSHQDPSRTFVMPDLTGHGFSPPLPPGATLETMAKDLVELLPSQGTAEIVGHSLGGRVALAALRLAPERISRVTLLDIAPGPVPASISEGSRVLKALLDAPQTAADRETFRHSLLSSGLEPAIAEWVMTNLRPGGDGYVWRIDARALAEAAPRSNAVDLWDVVESRGTRIRAIRGGRSPYVTSDDVRRFEAAGVEVATLPEAGHFVHVDALAALVELLTEVV